MLRCLQILALFPLITAAIPAQAQDTGKSPSLGTLENGIYHHNLTGVQFNVPADWVITNQAWSSASAGAQVVTLRDTASNVIATVWLRARIANPENIPAELDHRLDTKLMQRNNFAGYKFRTEGVQHTIIGGQPALSAVADYTRTGQHMVEYVTWIDGEKSRIVFASRMPEAQFNDFLPRFNAVIQSALVP